MKIRFALGLTFLFWTAGPIHVSAGDGPVARIEPGIVRGTFDEGTVSFKGIPYAAPPVGSLRWRSPAPVLPWSGIRSTVDFGPACPQPTGPHFDGKPVGDEDCLTLNVWAPSASFSEKKPVLVFVHGGFFVTQSSAEKNLGNRIYDGAYLSKRGDVVVVTINYRLGALGFVGHPGLSAESAGKGSGNYGILDQIAALRWVQANIGAFGGNPANVTIFGESSGASSIGVLLASPEATGLFSKAILESAFLTTTTQEQAERKGVRLAERIGCGALSDGGALSCMRGKSADQVVAAIPESFGGPDAMSYEPNLQRSVLPVPVVQALREGASRNVPVLLGTNSNEASILLAPIFGTDQVGSDNYGTLIAKVYGATVAPFLEARYPLSGFKSPKEALVQLVSDHLFQCPARRLLRALSTANAERASYRYLFSHTSKSLFLRSLGAAHGFEIPFVFHNFSPVPGFGADSDEKTLSDRVISYWTRFAAFGNPNAPAPEAVASSWARYNQEQDNFLRIDEDLGESGRLDSEYCDFWDGVAG